MTPRWLLAATLALAGCTVGPDFKRPAPDVGAGWRPSPPDVASRTYGGTIDMAWWKSFGDPELVTLVQRLAVQNLDLATAAERVEQARATRRVVAAQALPHIDADARYQRERDSPNGIVSLTQPAPGASVYFQQYTAEASASWELDLFGRIRRSIEAADARTQVLIEERRAIALSAVAELASTYMQLRLAQAQERVVRRNVLASQTRSKLVRDRFAVGAASELDVAQAEAQLSQIEQDLPFLLETQARLGNAVAFLLAEQPRALDRELARSAGAQPLVPPSVPIGLPSDLVRRRPDIRAAEADLHAATAETGVAVASFFPSVSLSGLGGLDSLHFGSFFDWASRMFMAGPTLSVPIFEGGRLRGTLALRRSEQREAALTYRKTVLRAFHDVDDGLSAYAQAQHSRADNAATVRLNERTLRLAQDRYALGATSYLDVIDAQAALYASQNALAQANARVETSLVQLYKALGGGWDTLLGPHIVNDPPSKRGTRRLGALARVPIDPPAQ